MIRYRVLLLVTVIFIQGCMNVATTGAQAVYNRHHLQREFNDQYATLQIYHALKFKTHQFDNANIAISTYHGEVLLAGQVPTLWQKIKAGQIARHVASVDAVYNLLSVQSPSSVLTRISDTWITTKIKSKYIFSDDLDVSQIKVVTENGTVYLMGVLAPEEANAAVDLASDTDGVQKVVKIFSYIRISKT